MDHVAQTLPASPQTDHAERRIRGSFDISSPNLAIHIITSPTVGAVHGEFILHAAIGV